MFRDFDDLLPARFDSGPRSRLTGDDLVVELPGVKKADVSLTVEGRQLKLEASRGDRKWSQTWSLAPDVDAAAVAAGLQDGLLTIRLPLRADAQKRTVVIS